MTDEPDKGRTTELDDEPEAARPEDVSAGPADAEPSRPDPTPHQRAGAAAYAAAQHAAPRPEQAAPQPERATPQPGEAAAGATEPPAQPAPDQQPPPDLDELAARAEKADEYLLLAQRTQADFENYRKRAARDAALAQERGVARLAKELLPAIDNLDRALQAANAYASGPAGPDADTSEVAVVEAQLADGLRLVHAEVIAALGRVGIEPFTPTGEPFDPTVHEAVAQQPIEGAQSGTVAEVFQQGYRLGETVLRPARVLVAA